MLNGEPGPRIHHMRGVCQGDPLSPMLFLLAMEPLHRMFTLAQQQGIITFLNKNCEHFRFSLYADDAAVFISPKAQDWNALRAILDIFGQATGLHTNLAKTEIYTIRCDTVHLQQILGTEHQLSTFPCRYLGLPLHTRKITRQCVQPVVQAVADRLPGWKTDFLTYPGRELLVKTVLTAMPTYFLTVFKFPRWAISRVDRFRRSFLWKGKDPQRVRGGQCLVKWEKCTRPRKLGGLGIKDLDKFGRALRLRWLWHNWDQCDRPWKQLLKYRDKTDRDLFFASTFFTIGNGKDTPFWEAKWLNGVAPKTLAPNLYKKARFK